VWCGVARCGALCVSRSILSAHARVSMFITRALSVHNNGATRQPYRARRFLFFQRGRTGVFFHTVPGNYERRTEQQQPHQKLAHMRFRYSFSFMSQSARIEAVVLMFVGAVNSLPLELFSPFAATLVLLALLLAWGDRYDICILPGVTIAAVSRGCLSFESEIAPTRHVRRRGGGGAPLQLVGAHVRVPPERVAAEKLVAQALVFVFQYFFGGGWGGGFHGALYRQLLGVGSVCSGGSCAGISAGLVSRFAIASALGILCVTVYLASWELEHVARSVAQASALGAGLLAGMSLNELALGSLVFFWVGTAIHSDFAPQAPPPPPTHASMAFSSASPRRAAE
jgi:hypothetical protein